MAGWEEKKTELEALECAIYAASVDAQDQAKEVIEEVGLTYSFAYGVTREQSELFGAWWSEDRGADEALQQITNRERRRSEQEQAKH